MSNSLTNYLSNVATDAGATQRADYPFTAASTMKSGSVVIPGEAVLDARICHIGVDETTRVSRITSTGPTLELEISTNAGVLGKVSCTATGQQVPSEVVDASGRKVGVLLLNADLLRSIINGKSLTFAYGALQFVPFCLVRVTPVVDALVDSTGQPAFGSIALVAQSGVRLEVDPGTGQVTVNVTGERLYKRVLDHEFVPKTPVRKVRVVNESPTVPGLFIPVAGTVTPDTRGMIWIQQADTSTPVTISATSAKLSIGVRK